MDRYVRVEQRKGDQSSIEDNEVRIMSAGKMRNYITYATALFVEKDQEAVKLKAMGRAINKTVTVAEIIKRRIPGLHQHTDIGSVDITDTWEPLEEGLSRLETVRHVSMIVITLSKALLDASLPGYQPPLAEELVKPLHAGGQQPQEEGASAAEPGRGQGQPQNPSAGFGRIRGRGRSGRGPRRVDHNALNPAVY